MEFGESLSSQIMITAATASPYLGAALAYLVAAFLLFRKSRKAGWAVLLAGALLGVAFLLMAVGSPLFQRWAMDHVASYGSMRWAMAGRGFFVSGVVCTALFLALWGAAADRGAR